MLDVEKMAEALLAGTQALIVRAIAPLQAENKALRDRLDSLHIPTPKDGRDADPEEVAGIVMERLAPSLDGIEKAVADIPPAPELPDIPALVANAVDVALKAIPTPKDGRDGRDGTQGERGEKGEQGPQGEKGEQGAIGDRGQDGLGFDDVNIIDEERAFTIRMQRGDAVKEWRVEKPGLFYRGVWTPGEAKKGDAVTWGGSLWVAVNDTDEKPDVSDDWKLAVKRGRNAKTPVGIGGGNAGQSD